MQGWRLLALWPASSIYSPLPPCLHTLGEIERERGERVERDVGHGHAVSRSPWNKVHSKATQDESYLAQRSDFLPRGRPPPPPADFVWGEEEDWGGGRELAPGVTRGYNS